MGLPSLFSGAAEPQSATLSSGSATERPALSPAPVRALRQPGAERAGQRLRAGFPLTVVPQALRAGGSALRPGSRPLAKRGGGAACVLFAGGAAWSPGPISPPERLDGRWGGLNAIDKGLLQGRLGTVV